MAEMKSFAVRDTGGEEQSIRVKWVSATWDEVRLVMAQVKEIPIAPKLQSEQRLSF